jgi:hypothetical protein
VSNGINVRAKTFFRASPTTSEKERQEEAREPAGGISGCCWSRNFGLGKVAATEEGHTSGAPKNKGDWLGFQVSRISFHLEDYLQLLAS